MRGLVACAALGALALLSGCASSVEVRRLYSPEDAAAQERARLTPVAVVRGHDELPIPPNARIEDTRVAWSNEPSEHVHRLRPGDVIEKDADGRIVAVRSGSEPPVVTSFVPGTASSPEGSDEVRGRLRDRETVVRLEAGDRIAMRGSFAPDESIPGGGRVATSRATGALVAGVALFLLSYGPAAYVGATSPLWSDRVLMAPVAGPWIDLANRPSCVPPAGSNILPVDPCIFETVSRVALVAAGGIEALAAVLVLVGLPSSSRVVYDQDRGVGWTLVPHAGPGSSGVSAVGRF